MPTPQRKKDRFHGVMFLLLSLPFLALGGVSLLGPLLGTGANYDFLGILFGVVLLFVGAFLVLLCSRKWYAFKPIESGMLIPGCFDYQLNPAFPKARFLKLPNGRIALFQENEDFARPFYYLVPGVLLVALAVVLGGLLGQLGLVTTFRRTIVLLVLGSGGFVLLAMAVWEWLRDKGMAGLSVELNKDPVAPGEPFQFYVRPPKVGFERMEVRLIGEEVGFWRRNKTKDGKGPLFEERYRFVHKEVGEVEKLPEDRKGMVLAGTTMIPQGAMHSIVTRAGRVVWGLEVRLLESGLNGKRCFFPFRVIPLEREVLPDERGDAGSQTGE